MSRATLIAIAFVSLVMPLAAGPADPHLDSTVITEGCQGCHSGHGMSDSPMLKKRQKDLCLDCHGEASSLGSRREGSVRPRAIAVEKPFSHPMDENAFSRHENAITCSSCHSPHRGSGPKVARGEQKVSPRDPSRLEYELCEECHGERPGSAAGFTLPVGRKTNPSNRSYHPVEVASLERSPSVDPALSGRQVNCTDCHGNDDPGGGGGPHASNVPHLLRADYTNADGGAESENLYELCYSCHDRDSILRGDSFPGHRKHIVEIKTSCSTCHDPHGALQNRALIRFGNDLDGGLLAPSQLTGRLEFQSDVPGSGACYVTCHGYDHGPEAYGPMELLFADSEERVRAPGMQLPSRRRSVRRPH